MASKVRNRLAIIATGFALLVFCVDPFFAVNAGRSPGNQ